MHYSGVTAHMQIYVVSYTPSGLLCVCSNTCLETTGFFLRPENLVFYAVSSCNRSLDSPVNFSFGIKGVSVVTEMVALCSCY